MANNLYKYIAFSTISFALAYTCFKLESSFVEKFTENLLPLLTTLFAINIASSTLIAGKIREIQDVTKFEFVKTKINLKKSFYEQIIYIAVAFIVTMLRESEVLQKSIETIYLNITCNSVLFFCFIIYLDIIRDIGKSLFDLLDFKI